MRNSSYVTRNIKTVWAQSSDVVVNKKFACNAKDVMVYVQSWGEALITDVARNTELTVDYTAWL